MSVIKFQTNIPVALRMRSIEGKPVESQFGGVQHMFSADEGTFYVSEVVGSILSEQLEKLDVRIGEPVEITKAEVSRPGGRKGIQWQVAKTVTPAEGLNGTFAPELPITPPPMREQNGKPPSELVEKLQASIAMIEARKQASAPADQPKWAQTLSSQTKHVLDVYAELVNYASARHGNAVKPDDIRAMMTTVFINLSKGGNANAA